MAKDTSQKRWFSDSSNLFTHVAPKICMVGFDCRPAVRCHSISKKRTLRRIAEVGKVIAVMPSDHNGEASLGLQGVSQVSTFSGFCAKHDQELFASIDNFDFEPENIEQRFLFGYRTIARYHYYKLSWRYAQEAMLTALKNARAAGDTLRSDDSDETSRILTESEVDQLIQFRERDTADAVSISTNILQLMGRLNSAITNEQWSVLATRVIELPDEYPVAQSTSIGLDGVGRNGLLHMITVNVIPQNGRTFALMSCTAGHGTSCIDEHIERFRVDGELNDLAALTHIMCMGGDPIAFQPSYWHSLPSETKTAFQERLNLWMHGGIDPVNTDGTFNIFQKIN